MRDLSKRSLQPTIPPPYLPANQILQPQPQSHNILLPACGNHETDRCLSDFAMWSISDIKAPLKTGSVERLLAD
nr:hypothetical transcript [Hymenolepis microstoma]CUU98386.1 hypothetical transcript [Hymenolepis microstoma]